MPDNFSPELRRFIDGNIESLAQLETLLVLRQDPQRQWTAGQIATALYIPAEMALMLLRDLVQRGFVKMHAPAEVFSYEPSASDAAALIEQLADVYRQRRVAVISAIYSKPMNKVQTFADAFRLRKDKEN